jgi:hypothetical protein
VEDRGDTFLSSVPGILPKLHGVTTQIIVLFMVTAMRTSITTRKMVFENRMLKRNFRDVRFSLL